PWKPDLSGRERGQEARLRSQKPGFITRRGGRRRMRWYIIRALLAKEVQRHLANRGGVALALLLVAAAVLLSVFAPEEAGGGTGLVGGVHHCFVEYDRPTPLVEYLRRTENQPPELRNQLVFRELAKADT